MKKFTNFLRDYFGDYFGLCVLVFLIVVGVISFLIYDDYQASRFDKTIRNQTIEANKAILEAVNANGAAISFDAERRTEDARRTATIKPKLDAVRSNSNNSKISLERAKGKLNETNKNLGNLNASRPANCSELARLFPDKKFQYCQP